MQVKAILLAVLCTLVCTPALAGPERPDGGPDRGGRDHRWPGVIIEPNIVIERDRKPNVEDPAFIMAELGRCTAAGIRLFVDCLRHNHGSVAIRRLEACVGSETIPADPGRIEPCLPLPGPP